VVAIMTVREWFRLQRGAIWARGDEFNSTLHTVTLAVVRGEPIESRLYIGHAHRLIWNVDPADAKALIEQEAARDSLLTTIRLQMRDLWK